jgi:hypothetical protein
MSLMNFSMLRGIKQTRKMSCLHSFVGIGPFSILELTERTVWPFNIQHALRSPNFEEKDVVELLAQVKEDYGNIFDDRIPLDIFARTSGHRGLTGFCGMCLLEIFRGGEQFVSYENWIRFTSQQLIQRLPEWATMQKLVNTLRDPTSQSARTLLLTHFLPSNSSVTVNEEQDPLARFLTAEGALVNTNEPQTYEIPSPLIRNLLFCHLYDEFPLGNVPNEPIPFRNDGETIDIQKMLLKAVQCIDRSYMLRSGKYSFKMAQIRGIERNTRAKRERLSLCFISYLITLVFFGARVYQDFQ